MTAPARHATDPRATAAALLRVTARAWCVEGAPAPREPHAGQPDLARHAARWPGAALQALAAPGASWQPPRISRLEAASCVALAVVMLAAGLLAR